MKWVKQKNGNYVSDEVLIAHVSLPTRWFLNHGAYLIGSFKKLSSATSLARLLEEG